MKYGKNEKTRKGKERKETGISSSKKKIQSYRVMGGIVQK